jgi:hypothetical protein
MMRTATLLGLTCAGLLLSGCGLGPFGAAAPTPSAVATTAAAATSAPTATRAAATAPATATPAPPKPTNAPEPEPSETVWVGNTDGEGVYLRHSPVMADRARAYVDGTPLAVVGEDVDGDDQHWKHVRAPDGLEGYVPSIYTVDTPP